MTSTTQQLYLARFLLHLQKNPQKTEEKVFVMPLPVLDLLEFLNNYEIVFPYMSCIVIIFFSF